MSDGVCRCGHLDEHDQGRGECFRSGCKCRQWKRPSKLVRRVAAAMYNAPDPDEDTGSTTWPPKHPADAAFWITRAQAALEEITEQLCSGRHKPQG